MADDGETAASNSRLQELLALSDDERRSLAKEIAEQGLEPGCWFQLPDSDLTHSAVDVREVVESAAELPAIEVGEVEEFSGEHPWDPPSDGGDAWIVITQSCDLLRDVRDEPLVQVALLRQAADDIDLVALWRKSSRVFPIDPTGERSRYYVDLRSQAFVPKHLLRGVPVRQALPRDADSAKHRPRTRFALRVGQRHSRAGIPTQIVNEIVSPVIAAVEKKRGLRNRLDASFSEWLLRPLDETQTSFALLAVSKHSPETADFRAVEDLFHEELWKSLPESVRQRLDEEASRVVSLEDLRLYVWLESWKLDLDFLTFGAKGDPESPPPQT